MSSIPQTTDNGNSVSDFATKFMKRFHLGKLLFKCNAGKVKCYTKVVTEVANEI